MHTLLPRAAKFRHVVFSDGRHARGRAINFALASEQVVVRQRQGRFLSSEEDSFLTWLFSAAGLDVRKYRGETLKRRVPACLRALRAASPSHARWLIEQSPSLLSLAVTSLVIGVTAFFRDAAVFEALRRDVLPLLGNRKPAARIWSVGCSDGSELYSVAILLAELGLLHRCHLLGTDCRSDAVKRAQAGVYDAASVRGIAAETLDRYFVQENQHWRIQPWLRTCVQWRTANVLSIVEPGLWDVILCRNMAMYMHAEAVAELWDRLETQLKPGGVLVLGKAERPAGSTRLTAVGPCLYRRTG